MPKLQIPKKLRPLIDKKKRYKVIIGGRNSAKSTTVGDICLMDCVVHSLKIGCFREFQNSIEESVHSLLQEEIERLDLKGFSIQNNHIYHINGGSFSYHGLARNVGSIKSFHGFSRFWIEEGQFLSNKSINILTKTIREEDSEIWITANPMSRADPFSQRFIVPYEAELIKHGYYEDDMHLIIVCNYKDNYWHNEVMEKERLHDELTLSTAEYEHIWLGKFNDYVENAIITADMFDAAVDAHLKLGFTPSGMKIVSHDPSDLGADPKGLAYRHGTVLLDVQEMTSGDLLDGCNWALDYAITNQVDAFIWDGDGMGVGLRKAVSDGLAGKHIKAHMFLGSGAVYSPDSVYMEVGEGKQEIGGKEKTNKDAFYNRRAQRYWGLRDRLFATYLAVVHKQYINPDDMLSISSKMELIDKFRSEVCRIPKKPNGAGKIQIMSKDEMKKPPYRLPSPNLSDSVMMQEDFEAIVVKDDFVGIKFDSLWS